MSLEIKHFYEFENFRLDLNERVLLRDGKPLFITPKVFHLLKILVEHHGHIVEKKNLLSEIWADSFVEDGNLTFNARMLRKALSDDAQHPRFIETVPRRGYRFIADVKEISPVQDSDIATSHQKHFQSVKIEVADKDSRKFQRYVIPLSKRNLADARQTSFAPNGKIVFSSAMTGNNQIWIIDADGSEPRQLTNNDASNSSPIFAPMARKSLLRKNRRMKNIS